MSQDENNCCICLESLKSGEVDDLICGHTIHSSRLNDLKSNSIYKCPLCRQSILLEFIEEEQLTRYTQTDIITTPVSVYNSITQDHHIILHSSVYGFPYNVNNTREVTQTITYRNSNYSEDHASTRQTSLSILQSIQRSNAHISLPWQTQHSSYRRTSLQKTNKHYHKRC